MARREGAMKNRKATPLAEGRKLRARRTTAYPPLEGEGRRAREAREPGWGELESRSPHPACTFAALRRKRPSPSRGGWAPRAHRAYRHSLRTIRLTRAVRPQAGRASERRRA